MFLSSNILRKQSDKTTINDKSFGPEFSNFQISWLQKKQCKTKVSLNASNKELLTIIKRAEKWLQENSYENPILKWKTKAWGEIPADFGRK